MLKLESISREYLTPGSEQPLVVLRDISISLPPGQSIAIVGPSGSGKSTLLNMIGALDRPTSGRVVLNGIDYNRLNEDQLAEIRNRQLGFIFQLHHLLPQCTVLENILIPTLVGANKPNPVESSQRALSLLDRVGLSRFTLYRPGQLSGGQKQRVAVVRALINRPTLLLADEPTGSLDQAGSEQVMNLLIELTQLENTGLIMATHADSVARRAGKTYKLSNSRLHEWL